MIFVFRLLAWEFAEERGGHTWIVRDSDCDRWKAGRIICGLYIIMSLPIVS